MSKRGALLSSACARMEQRRAVVSSARMKNAVQNCFISYGSASVYSRVRAYKLRKLNYFSKYNGYTFDRRIRWANAVRKHVRRKALHHCDYSPFQRDSYVLVGLFHTETFAAKRQYTVGQQPKAIDWALEEGNAILVYSNGRVGRFIMIDGHLVDITAYLLFAQRIDQSVNPRRYRIDIVVQYWCGAFAVGISIPKKQFRPTLVRFVVPCMRRPHFTQLIVHVGLDLRQFRVIPDVALFNSKFSTIP